MEKIIKKDTKLPEKNPTQKLPEKVQEPSDDWKIDKYQFIEVLGKGSFSKVYRAKHTKDKKEYAIKVINDERVLDEYKAVSKLVGSEKNFASLDDMLLSIRDEAKVLVELEHPNILKFYGINEKGVYSKRDGKKQIATLYSVSEVCPNGDLWEYIEYSGRFDAKYCRSMFKQIIEALEYMHNHGFAHRDIKPANMLQDKDFNLRLNDFGFATCVKARKNSGGKLETILGTPEYEAPELIKEVNYWGNAVDIFAAGVTLFNLFTGKPPFRHADLKNPKENPQYTLIAKKHNDYWKEFSIKYWAIKDPDAKNLFPKNFKNLIFGMQDADPSKRLKCVEIKNHPWMQEETATSEEMEREFKRRHGPMVYEKTQKLRCRLQTFAFKKKVQIRGPNVQKEILKPIPEKKNLKPIPEKKNVLKK